MNRFFTLFASSGLLLTLGILAGCATADAPTPGTSGDKWQVSILPENALALRFIKNGTLFGTMDMIGWGPNWGWAPPSKQGYAVDGVVDVATPFTSDPHGANAINVREQAWRSGARTITCRYFLSADGPRTLTQLSNAFSFVGAYNAGTIEVTKGNGQKSDPLPIPTQRSAFADPIAKVVFKVQGIGDIQATFNPPLTPHVESGALRMRLAHDTFPAGTQTEVMTLTFPGDVQFLASKADLDANTKGIDDKNWFQFKPANDTGPSVIGMEDWMDKPAGQHGFVKMVGDHFEFDDGTRVKFWGTNLAYTQNTPEKAQAELTAARFAKYGFNCVRMHKFTNPGEGIGTDTATLAFDPAAVDRLDYFTAQMKKHGVYYGWSHSYHYKVRPGDKDQLLAYDEIASGLGGDTYGLINGAPDVQDLMIKMVVTLLKHKNPYTGLTYAQDPALVFLEVQNEDDIFFYTFTAIDKCPTYKEKMRQRFGAWLQKKYRSQAALQKAWGTQLQGSEQVGGSVDFQSNPWFFGDDSLGAAKDPFQRRRLLDNALFLHDEQNTFYSKFVKAVRAAGYRGNINGSPWLAPTTLPHLLNLKSDYLAGYIDRHNYFQGDDAVNASMLSDPGSGYLGTGLQQVADRPFGLSEWCHVYPNALSAEGPAIMAAYAMGLQGWDASYEFQSFSTGTGFQADAGHLPWNVWSADVPNQIGQAPTLARMIYRGDVKEGDVISTRKVSNDQFSSGDISFTEKAVFNGDVKTFSGSVPPEALAAGKVLVQFTDTTQPSTFPDMTKYQSGKTITSNTNQLVWDYSGKGYFKVLTPGTVGVVGFAENVPVKSGSVQMRLKSPYASVFVTAIEKNATLENCKHALVSVLARQLNTGFKYFAVDGHVIDYGAPPVMVEGIQVNLAFLGRPVQAVNILDQDGRAQPGKTLAASGPGVYAIDTARDKTMYYEVVFR